jgi:type IV secretory pathway TrbD component
MKLNVGSTDRMIRIVIAVIAAILALTVAKGALAIVLWIVAAIMLVTGVVRVCPLYLPFKISTNKNP